MGCMSSVGRVVLIVLNLVFLLVSLALIAVGVVLRFFVRDLVQLFGLGDILQASDRQSLFIPGLDQLGELPFLADVGVALLVFGCLLFLVSFCACCGACCQWRPLLIVFIVVMTILVLAQAVVGGLFLARNSPLHKQLRESLVKEIQKNYKESDTDDMFSMAINMLNYLLDCCGINGNADFGTGTFIKSCCKRSVMETDAKKCATSTASSDFNNLGCYDKLLDTVLEQKTVAVIVVILVLLLQVAEIIFAILVAKDANKVGPV